MTGITQPASRSLHCQSCSLYLTIEKKVKEDYLPFTAGIDLPVTDRAQSLKSGHFYSLSRTLILGVHLGNELVLLLFYQ